MSKKKKKAWAENGLEDWGAYMAAKKEKLEDQFQEEAKKEFSDATSLFSGIAIFVNGYTNPCADELKRLMMAHGGVYHHYMRSKITTHIVASNLPYSKIVAYRKSQNPLPICKPEWITDSIDAKKLLDWRPYVLYSNCTKSQPQLAFAGKKPETRVSMRKEEPEDRIENEVVEERTRAAPPSSSKDSNFLTDFYNNSRLHHIATMGATFKNYVNELRSKNKGEFPGLERLTKSLSCGTRGPRNDASDSEEDLFESPKTEAEADKRMPVIMHIDMDCFFVSVGLRNRPEMRGFPVAVAHAKGNKQASKNCPESGDSEEDFGSMSEIASCSYEARKAGVKNGMFLGQALKLCPDLKTIKYDFEGYKNVSYALYDTVASYCLTIEAVSCDEMYADVTKILLLSKLTPLEFATIIRNEIKEKTQCPVSTGFGSNKLQARLATRKAKPDGQFYLDSKSFLDVIGPMSVRDLPGVGYSTSQLLHKMEVKTCLDLREISLIVLQKECGKKNGETLYNMCRGIDNSKLMIEHVRKSVSAEVNYGIRFQSGEEAVDFLKKLSHEVCTRLKNARARGRSLTLKLMVRAKNAPIEAAKFMGHGICDNFTKSKNLVAPIDDPSIVIREVISLWNAMQQPFEDIRGIGIQIARLESSRTRTGSMMNFIKKSNDSEAKKKMEKEENSLFDKKYFQTGSKSRKVNKDLEKSINAQIDDSVLAELPEEIVSEILESRGKKEEKVESSVCSEKMEEKKRSSEWKEKRNSLQTKQENYFKQVKSTSGKSVKAKMPPIEEIDMSVLVELPEDIRNEIMNEYKEKKCEDKGLPVKERPEVREEGDVSFSQIDPDFLAALSEDMKNDVEMYCLVKKKEKLKKLSGAKVAPSNVLLKKRNTTKPTKKNNRLIKSNNKIVNNNVKSKSSDTGSKEKMRIEKNLECSFLDGEFKMDGKKNGTLEQREEIMSHHSSFIGKKAKTEEQEMLTSLVNYLFTLPVQQVKMQIQTWITRNNEVNEIDLLSLATFLSMLPKKKRLEDLHIFLKTMHRCITKTGSCVWHETYRRTIDHVQLYMMIEYSSKMMLPSIECDLCNFSELKKS